MVWRSLHGSKARKIFAPAAKKAGRPGQASPGEVCYPGHSHAQASLADSHDLANKQAEAVLGDLVTLDDGSVGNVREMKIHLRRCPYAGWDNRDHVESAA
jgi:hypothetical protein